MKRITAARLKKLIFDSQGNLAACARAIGVTRGSVYDYVSTRPELKQAIKDARETLVDNAESALAVAVTEKQGWAVCFTLKCLGKDRGYIERQEVTGANGGPLQADLTSGGKPFESADARKAELAALLDRLIERQRSLPLPEPSANGNGVH